MVSCTIFPALVQGKRVAREKQTRSHLATRCQTQHCLPSNCCDALRRHFASLSVHNVIRSLIRAPQISHTSYLLPNLEFTMLFVFIPIHLFFPSKSYVIIIIKNWPSPHMDGVREGQVQIQDFRAFCAVAKPLEEAEACVEPECSSNPPSSEASLLLSSGVSMFPTAQWWRGHSHPVESVGKVVTKHSCSSVVGKDHQRPSGVLDFPLLTTLTILSSPHVAMEAGAELGLLLHLSIMKRKPGTVKGLSNTQNLIAWLLMCAGLYKKFLILPGIKKMEKDNHQITSERLGI